jgi:hypothetical protein
MRQSHQTLFNYKLLHTATQTDDILKKNSEPVVKTKK